MLMCHICSASVVGIKKESKQERIELTPQMISTIYLCLKTVFVLILMDDDKMGGRKQKFYVSIFIRFTTIAFCLISTCNTDMSLDAVHITDITQLR